MATVIYNGCGVIPAPLVSFVDEPIIAGNQHRIGNTYKITINGTIVNYKGSPASAPYAGGSPSTNWGGPNNQFWVGSNYPADETNPTHSYHQLFQIESKQEALRNLFATEGMWLEFQSADGSAPMKAQIKNVQISFQEGLWFTECKYTITCDADILYLNGQIYQGLPFSDLIQQAGETWDIQPAENIKTFSVSHTVSAVGKRGFDSLGNEASPAWQAAKNFVNSQLVLGWDGRSAYSSISGHAIFNQSSLASGVLDFTTFKPYNFTRSENVDELAGSYSCTESWVLANSSGTNIYTITNRAISEESYTNINVTVQGSIKGYYEQLFDYDKRYAAAEYEWAQLGGPTGLLNIVNQYVTGYQFNIQPTQLVLDYNYNEGAINYTAEFSNTLYEGDAFEQWTLARKTSADNYLTTYDINGTVKGRRYVDDTDQKAAFKRAYVWWSTLSGSNYNALYERILSSTYFPEAASIGLQPSPASKSIDYNEGDGLISYSLAWNNRNNDRNFPSDWATDEWQINKSYSREDGITHYNVNGTVRGLNITDSSPRQSKFDNASGYFYTYVQPNLYQRVVDYYGVQLPDTSPMSIEIGTFPIQGEITYGYTFWNVLPPIFPGALSEHIVMTENNSNRQVNVIGRIPIIGRSQGDILQDMKTTTVKSRSLSIEVVLGPASGVDAMSSIVNKPSYDAYVNQIKPPNAYCVNWSDTFDWRFGRYSLNCEWIFE